MLATLAVSKASYNKINCQANLKLKHHVTLSTNGVSNSTVSYN